MHVSQKCQSHLFSNFGRENRIIRNYIKILQNLKQTEKVKNFTEELTKKNLNDVLLKKNHLAFQKSVKPSKEYVLDLVQYLKDNWQDEDVWLELALMYERDQK
jgi:hypothetical protein